MSASVDSTLESGPTVLKVVEVEMRGEILDAVAIFRLMSLCRAIAGSLLQPLIFARIFYIPPLSRTTDAALHHGRHPDRCDADPVSSKGRDWFAPYLPIKRAPPYEESDFYCQAPS